MFYLKLLYLKLKVKTIKKGFEKIKIRQDNNAEIYLSDDDNKNVSLPAPPLLSDIL